MPPTISEDWTIHWPNTPKGLFLMWLDGFFCKTLIVNIFGWWWCVEGYCIQWESSIPTQGSAELHGVAFCDEHGVEPEWLLQGHQERIPQGTPSRPWHEPAESAGQHKIPLTQHFSGWYYYLSVQKKKNLLNTEDDRTQQWHRAEWSYYHCCDISVFCVCSGCCFRDHPQKRYYSQTALPSGIMHPITDLDSS